MVNRKYSEADSWVLYLDQEILMGEIVLMTEAKRGGPAICDSGGKFVVAIASE